MGENHAGQFYREVAAFFSEDANQTAVAVAHFVKSRRAYDLVNKTTRTEKDNDELAKMFGSMLGVQVSGKFVASLRAEEMGRIIGYALSGLCESNMHAWNDPAAGKKLRQEHGSFDKYLHHTIRNSDKWASYRFENRVQEEGRFVAALKINEFEGAPADKARGRNVVDHCFVYHNPKGGGVITLGTSTAKTMAQEHGFSFAQPILAAQALVGQKTINGQPNPYYGYEIQPYCFFAGHMPTTELDGTVARSPLVKMLEMGRTAAQGQVSPQQIMELAWSPFFSLFASTNPSPIVGRGLESANPMIAGSDTFPLYRKQVNEERQKRTYSNSRRLATMVMGYVGRTAALLAQGNTVMNLEAAGPQKSLQPILETLLKISSNHFHTFPLKDNQSLSTAEKQSIQRAGVAFGQIAEKMKAKLSHRRIDLAGQFEEESDKLTSEPLLNKRIKRDSAYSAQLDTPPAYSEALHNAVDSLRHYDSGVRLEAMAASLQNMVASQNAKSLFEKVFLEIDQQLEDEAPSHKAAKFWADYKSCLLHALADGENRDWQGEHYANWSALKQDRTSFARTFPDHPAAKLVNATGTLIGQQSPTGSHPLSNRLEYDAVQSALLKTCKAITSLARSMVSDSLAADLRSMGDQPRSRKKTGPGGR